MLLYLSISLATLAYVLYIYFTRTFNYWKDRNVPGPTPTPFFGNMKESALRRKPIGVVYKEIYDDYPEEKVVGVYRMTTPSLLLRDLDVIKNIMIKDFDAFLDRGQEFSKEGLGANLFSADGDTWQVLRNRFTPLFTSGKLKNMLYLMTERGDKFVEYVKEVCIKEPEQEIHELVQKYTVSTISACAFGLDVDLNSEQTDELKWLNDIVFKVKYFQEIDMLFPGIFSTIGNMSKLLLPKVFTIQYFHKLVRSVISQRNGKPSNRNDFMDLILELREQKEIQGASRGHHTTNLSLELTEDVIAAQAFVFYIAGYETSASTMAFMLYSLALHPEIQDKLIAEIDEVTQRHDGQVTYESLKEMKYMTQVFDETLRMYSLVQPLQRCAKVDYKIPDTDVTVKKGQMVLVSPMGIHHDKKYYPDPEKFDPERFSPENSRNRHPCANLSFGVGPRNCIGMRFAQFQSRVCIAKLLLNFRVEPSKNTKKTIEFDPYKVIINSLGGIPLCIVPRDK